ncbi:MAG: hypothetical protein ACYDG4_16795 [Desulfuromonadaceae bacterium]|jgi:hypothetical protein
MMFTDMVREVLNRCKVEWDEAQQLFALYVDGVLWTFAFSEKRAWFIATEVVEGKIA